MTILPVEDAQTYQAITCPRCRQTHENITMEPLTNPSERENQPTHWVMCPVLGEPIFANVVVVVQDSPEKAQA